MLLISKYELDCKPYNEEKEDVTWETSTLRTWLNNAFINNAFSQSEQALIATTTVSADENLEYSTKPGNATQDKVFLLSIKEVNTYFPSNEARMCTPTNYTIEQGIFIDSGRTSCDWWLRSPGAYQSNAACVLPDGESHENGLNVESDDCGVRPALWINL